MVERNSEANVDETSPNLVPRALTGLEVKQIVRDVIKMQREVAERRRKLGLQGEEAPGLTPDARESRYKGV